MRHLSDGCVGWDMVSRLRGNRVRDGSQKAGKQGRVWCLDTGRGDGGVWEGGFLQNGGVVFCVVVNAWVRGGAVL